MLWAFPWGEPGTTLEREPGPDTWQREFLEEIGEELRAGGDLGCTIFKSVGSGHGVGKSAMTSWLIKWALETKVDTRGTVTAMTDTQLKTKTWPELGKWHAMSMTRDLFTYNATSIHSGDADRKANWRIDAVPWPKSEGTASFAGLHNKGKRVIVLFDESSEIADSIWEVTEGACTDDLTQIIWCAFGNVTQTSGKFFETFSSSRWKSRSVDARTSRFSNKRLIAEWAKEYGEDSDFFRVRVLGKAPRVGVTNFISPEAVKLAMTREVPLHNYSYLPKILSVDPAHFGDDESVVTLRQGSKVLGMWWYSGLDGPDLASRIVDTWRQHPQVSHCYVDAIGVGASCCDALFRVPGFPLVRVFVSSPATDEPTYFNLRAELWGRMRAWLETGELPDDKQLADQLTSINYGFDGRSRIQLEAKKDLKKRGKPSPDRADSLALSFMAEAVRKVEAFRNVQARPVAKRRVVWTR